MASPARRALDPGSAGGDEKQIGQRSEDEFGSAEGRGFHGENDGKLAQKHQENHRFGWLVDVANGINGFSATKTRKIKPDFDG